jgi:hypothetical protein
MYSYCKFLKVRNEELHNLYSPRNIIRQIKSRRMRWAGHVERKKSVQGLGGEARRKQTTLKSKAYVRGLDENGS